MSSGYKDGRQLWYLWESHFSPEWCEQTIERILPQQVHHAAIGGGSVRRVDPSYRSSQVRWLDPKGAHSDISMLMMDLIDRSNRENFGFDLRGMYELQFTEYHAIQNGHYGWHHDVAFETWSSSERKLSIVVQLSDPSTYKGGDFEFFNILSPGENFLPQGSVLIFPSFYYHRVTTVTEGVRRSLVSWIEGPPWR